jgi:hypothetical protein
MLRKCQVKRKMKGKFEDEGVFSILLSQSCAALLACLAGAGGGEDTYS